MMKREEAQAMYNGMSMFMRGLKQSAVDYGKNVVGGAKIVGGAVVKGVKKLIPDTKKITDDLFGSSEQDKKNRAKGKALNDAYSGRNY